MRFDILNRLGVDDECGGQTDRIVVSKSAVSASRAETIAATALISAGCLHDGYTEHLQIHRHRPQRGCSTRRQLNS